MKSLLLSAVLILASLVAGDASAQCSAGVFRLAGRPVAHAVATPVRLLRAARPLQHLANLQPLRRVARVARGGVRFALGR